jgi:hypothetical protein
MMIQFCTVKQMPFNVANDKQMICDYAFHSILC